MKDFEKIKNAKQLLVLFNIVQNKTINMGVADPPRNLKLRLVNGTVLKRNTKWFRIKQDQVAPIESKEDKRKAINVKTENVITRPKREIKKPAQLNN